MTWNRRAPPPQTFDDGGSRWEATPFGNKGHFKLRLVSECDAMTGQAVSENFRIPYPHRLVHFEAKHTTATGANDTTALDAAQFKCDKKWSKTLGDSDWFILWDFSGVVAADFQRSFGETNERPITKYQITVNTTSTHLMFYEVIFQLLDKKGREAPNR